ISSNHGPAPPYTGEPPSLAEIIAEIHQLRNTIRNMEARASERDAAPAGNAHSNPQAERDIREALKPPKPEPFKGQATDIVPFLTRIKGYFHLFPTKLDTATKKVLFTAPLIQGNAKDWFEPILRDYLKNEEIMQDQETINIFAN
ncbi:hypothetical protein FANTH_9941, partial [Fusarium anthophilum]